MTDSLIVLYSCTIASSLDIVSANQSRENIILACLNNLSESVSSTSIFIAFLAGPCAVELTTSSVSLSPPLESGVPYGVA